MLTITILVSVYNKAETVQKCIDSLLAVKYLNKKILVVDGYSSDGSFEILKKYQKQIQLYQVQGNYSRALNWALDKVDTEYVALTDADCVVSGDWIDELLRGFDEPDVVATAGFCGTPEGLSIFQKVIGMELESRFKRFPQYILRAPTMNLCIRTEIAKQVKFDENIEVSIETDFGYRLTKMGRMKYMPNAKVWHYHRANLYSYFKQNMNQARGAVRTYLRHKDKLVGDHISTPVMMAQVPLGGIMIAGLLLSIIYKPAIYLTKLGLILLCIIYCLDLVKVTKEIKFYPYLLLIFFSRTFAWTLGCIKGGIELISGRQDKVYASSNIGRGKRQAS